MNYHKEILVMLIVSLVCAAPVMGATTYREGGPELSAAISGTNEFAPGQDATITVIVQNSGLNTVKDVWDGTIEREDNPTTAKVVRVGLAAGNAPVIIKSDPQDAGDLVSQATATVRISAKITQDATIGEYQLPLTISYIYLASSDQPAADILQSNYKQANVTFPVTIRIKPQAGIDVLDVASDNLTVGTSGYLDLKIKNSGSDDGKKATVKLLRNGNSPIVPVDSSVYIGDFPLNQTVSCRYKVAVSSNAEKQTYPVDVAVTYEDRYGDTVTSEMQTVGVPVGGKITFSVVSDEATVILGSDNVITVQYQNTGDNTAFTAQSRIIAVDPFTSSDNTAFLGDIRSGDRVTAHYQLSADTKAGAGNYSLDTEIMFRDAQDTSQVSDTFKIPVRVAAQPASAGTLQMLPIVVVTVLIVIGAGYYLLVIRKKK
jgi:hypothetical protein